MLTQPECLFYAILSFIWIEFTWRLYLLIRQHKVYQTAKDVPNELKGIMDKKTYDQTRAYGLDISCYFIARGAFEIALNTELFLLDMLPRFWQYSRSITNSSGYQLNEIVQSLVFILILNLFSTIIYLPISIYAIFVLEQAHGFNKQTAGFFINDKIKIFVLDQLIMLPLIAGVIYIARIGGDFFFIYLWLFAMVMMLFLMTVYPNWIAPLFDKYTVLPEGDLRTRIEELAASLEFPLSELYVVEGSKRSTHSNAYFYGFYKNKRIVLYDTLLKDYISSEIDASAKKDDGNVIKKNKKGCDNDEVLAVLGHELGHWKLNHELKILIITQVNLFLKFAVFGYMFSYEPMYLAFGFHDEQPVLIGLLIVFKFISLPYDTVLNFALMVMSRKFEFEADAFAKSLGKSEYLCRALIKLYEDNLGFPVYDWLYSMWHHSHPQLLERLKALDYKGKRD